MFSDWDLELVSADHGRGVLDDAPDKASGPGYSQEPARLSAVMEAGPLGGLSAV